MYETLTAVYACGSARPLALQRMSDCVHPRSFRCSAFIAAAMHRALPAQHIKTTLAHVPNLSRATRQQPVRSSELHSHVADSRQPTALRWVKAATNAAQSGGSYPIALCVCERLARNESLGRSILIVSYSLTSSTIYD